MSQLIPLVAFPYLFEMPPLQVKYFFIPIAVYELYSVSLICSIDSVYAPHCFYYYRFKACFAI